MSLLYVCMIFIIYTVQIPLVQSEIVIAEIDNVIKARTQT